MDDDLFRNQAHLYVQSDEKERTSVAGLRTEMLRLAPGETVTLKWAVYPIAGPDFYDFMNLVRGRLGGELHRRGRVGLGLPGGTGQDAARRDPRRGKREGIRSSFAADWAEWTPNERGTQRIGYGTDVFSDYWAGRRQTYLGDFQKIRQACPDVKVLAYYNSMRESSDDTPTRFSDSLMLNPAGQPITAVWTHTGCKNRTWAMVPTLTNSFGRAMLEVARRYYG